MFTVYVLFSEKFDNIHIGQTSDLEKRLEYHNYESTNSYTMKFRPWKIIHTEKFSTRAEAMKREKQLKTSRGRAFIRSLIKL